MAKILYVTRVPITAARFVLPLATKMRERGNHVEFAFGPGDGLQDMRQSGFPISVLAMESRSTAPTNARVLIELGQLIKRRGYDIVHTYSPVIGLYGRLAARAASAPIVIHSVIGSLLAAGVPLSHRLMYLTSELATSRLVDLFITLNRADARDLVRYRLAAPEKVASLEYEYGVDLNEFNPDAIDRERASQVGKSIGLEEGIPVIGFVGRMIGAKGILDLFEAYRRLRGKGLSAKLLYVGSVLATDKDRTSLARLQTLVKEAGLERNVSFLGFQKDVPLYLSLMDVVVLPSHHEGFPRIPVEAGAMGKPCISTATPGAEVAIEEGKTGYVVPIKDPARLAEALQKLLADPARARRMGQQARQRAVEHFDQIKIVDQQVQLYVDFLGASRRAQALRL